MIVPVYPRASRDDLTSNCSTASPRTPASSSFVSATLPPRVCSKPFCSRPEQGRDGPVMGTRVCVCLKVVPRAEVQLRSWTTHRAASTGPGRATSTRQTSTRSRRLSPSRQLGGGVVAVSMPPKRRPRHCGMRWPSESIGGSPSATRASRIGLVVTGRVLARVLQLEARRGHRGRVTSRSTVGVRCWAQPSPSVWVSRSYRVSGTCRSSTAGSRATRQTSVSEVVLDAPTPCVVALSGSANTPRYPSFREVVTAKRKEIIVLSAADLGLTPSEVGWAGARTRVLGLSPAQPAVPRPRYGPGRKERLSS